MKRYMTVLSLLLVCSVSLAFGSSPRAFMQGPDGNAPATAAMPVRGHVAARDLPTQASIEPDLRIAPSPPQELDPLELPEEPLFASELGEIQAQALISPSLCGAPLRGPFGQDVEIMLGPWAPVTTDPYGLDRTPGWYPQETLPLYDFWYQGSYYGAVDIAPSSDIAAAARGMEEIVAAWKDEAYANELLWSTWSASGRGDHSGPPGSSSPGGWFCPDIPYPDRSPRRLGLVPDGNPAMLSRNPLHWAVFARQGSTIKVREWEEGGAPQLGEWYALSGVINAASDPAAVSKAPNHMAVFYRSADGAIWFTEWNGQEWRDVPLSLSGAKLVYPVYLPLVLRGHLAGSTAADTAPVSSSSRVSIGASPTFTLTSELSAVSRNTNHLAVLGVDADNQLWIREWTNLNESDWSDTAWVKLMENVAIERPAVATRHSGHLGVAVRDTSGQPWYIGWAHAFGWRTPVSLADASKATLGSPLTLAATAIDAMSTFAADGSQIWHKGWDEDGGWDDWQQLADTDVVDGQALTAVVRRMDDVMLLGRRLLPDDVWEGVYKHYTSQDRSPSESPIGPSIISGGHPRGQALAWVDGETLWVGANEGETETWRADALKLSDGISESLTLPTHSYYRSDAVSVAAGDLDFDGDDEVIVATLSPTASISLLNVVVSPTLAVSITSSVSAAVPWDGFDVSAAIGDLDGDGRHDEVAVAYRTAASWAEIRFYEYLTTTRALDYRGSASVSVLENDLEMTIGRLYNEQPPREHLVVGSTKVNMTGPDADRSPGRVQTYRVTLSPTISISDTGNFSHVFSGPIPPFEPPYYISALATGDLDADGLEEIVYSFWNGIVTVDYDALGQGTLSAHEFFVTRPWPRSMAIGDIDRDGKAEIAMTGYNCHPSGTSFGHIIELMDEGQMKISGTFATSCHYLGWRIVLIDDLDNDSFRSDLVGCANEVADASVIAVVNGPPRWYQGGAPLQDAGGSFARTTETGQENEDGTRFNYGASLSVGIEAEINVPFIGTKIGEVRSSVTSEVMGSTGQSRATSSATTATSGYSFASGGSNPTAIGLVVYYQTNYRCLYYDVYPPGHRENSSRAMACAPMGASYEQVKSLEDWYSPGWKAEAGGSWANVGHPFAGDVTTANNVMDYTVGTVPPVDPFRVKWHDPGVMARCVTGGQTPVSYDWAIEQSQGEARVRSGSFDANVTVSAGATVGIVTVDTSVTTGYGSDWSRSVNWGTALSMAGAVDQYDTDVCPICQDYVIVPFVYEATASTQAGATYSYLEWDYYVRYVGGCVGAATLDTVADVQ